MCENVPIITPNGDVVVSCLNFKVRQRLSLLPVVCEPSFSDQATRGLWVCVALISIYVVSSVFSLGNRYILRVLMWVMCVSHKAVVYSNELTRALSRFKIISADKIKGHILDVIRTRALPPYYAGQTVSPFVCVSTLLCQTGCVPTSKSPLMCIMQ